MLMRTAIPAAFLFVSACIARKVEQPASSFGGAGSFGNGTGSSGVIGSGGAFVTGGVANSAGGAAPNGGVSGSMGGFGATSSLGGVNTAIAGKAGASGADTGGASNGGSGGGSAGMGGLPTTPRVGAPYRFPQNKRSSFCTYPTEANPTVAQTAYERWKRELVTTEGAAGFRRVRRPSTERDTTVSEGVGYGMIFAVVMDDPALFDDLWKYSQKFLNEHGLMHWEIGPDAMVSGKGAATDADEDIAWALVLADKKWGGRGTLEADYLTLAKGQIDKIWNHEIDHTRNDLVLAGDSWGEQIVFNPSYFAPNQYRMFGKVSGNVSGWNRVIDTGYATLEATLSESSGNLTNGLAPAWADASGKPVAPFVGAPTHYQYDSARVPFRIGMDYCDFGEPRAKTYLAKITGFFAGIGAANIVDGYALNGTPQAENTMPPGVQSALFVGAAGVGGMSDMRFQSFVNDTFGLLTTKEMLPPSYYFNLSWQVFALLMQSGNLFDYTLH
jgi:endo-1,4-beta-D-glucanase Y